MRSAQLSLVTEEKRGATALITYANPPLGTMTATGSVQMLAALRRAVDDPSVRAVVITGGLPNIFVRHYDVGELSNMSDGLADAPPAPVVATPSDQPEGGAFGQLIDLIAAAPKPVIAAINGLCMGGGFEITLACDIRVAGSTVTAIGLPETRAGIFPGGGGTQRLPRVIGEARALEMILRGRVVNGEEAGRIGMVHEVVADPLARALEIAAEFEAKGADGVAFAKRLVRAALDRPISEGLSDERRSFVEVMKADSARQALRASRPPAQIQNQP